MAISRLGVWQVKEHLFLTIGIGRLPIRGGHGNLAGDEIITLRRSGFADGQHDRPYCDIAHGIDRDPNEVLRLRQWVNQYVRTGTRMLRGGSAP